MSKNKETSLEPIPGDTPPAPHRRRGFELGQVVATPGALEAVGLEGTLEVLRRHARGDWGDIHPGDRGLNEAALLSGARIFSVYKVASPVDSGRIVRLWVITEAKDDGGKRQSTCILLPSEY